MDHLAIINAVSILRAFSGGVQWVERVRQSV